MRVINCVKNALFFEEFANLDFEIFHQNFENLNLEENEIQPFDLSLKEAEQAFEEKAFS